MECDDHESVVARSAGQSVKEIDTCWFGVLKWERISMLSLPPSRATHASFEYTMAGSVESGLQICPWPLLVAGNQVDTLRPHFPRAVMVYYQSRPNQFLL